MDFYEIGIVQCFKDVINFFKFKHEMKREFYRRDSKFNQFKLKINTLGNVVYMQLNCKDVDLLNANYDSEAMVMRRIQPVVEYLSRELDWGDYLTPQISKFVDEDENPSLSYGILFVFTPYNLTFTKFILMMLAGLGIIAGGVWGLLKLLA